MKKKLVSLLKMLSFTLALLLLSTTVIGDKKENTDRDKTSYYFAMGTAVNITIYDNTQNDNLNKKIVEKINELSDSIISWRNSGSQLYMLNNNYRPGEEFPLEDTLREILAMSYKICKDSDGALDITIRPLANVWNIEEGDKDDFSVPSEESIIDALSRTGYEEITLTDNGIILGKEGIIIDFGATGKGYALDVIRDEYISGMVDGGIISIGGSVLVYGSKPDGKPWNVGIRDPFGEDGEMLGYLTFSGDVDICISTSGDYEKYIEKNGIRYHHILDTGTGYPARSGLSSVTVVCENGLASDGLSTACFVIGYDKSLDILKEYQAEAVFVTNEGEVIITDGLKNIFTREKKEE